jgi:glutamine synthetase
MLAAALDGIDKKMQAPKPLNNINLYHLNKEERTKLGVTELPGSLAESLGELEKNAVLKEALGDFLFEAYLRAKYEEWDDFRLRVTDYEIERYLETA